MDALALVEADECPSCHGSLAETTDPRNDDAYIPEPPIRCHKCTAIEQKVDAVGNDPTTRQPRALMFTARLRPGR